MKETKTWSKLLILAALALAVVGLQSCGTSSKAVTASDSYSKTKDSGGAKKPGFHPVEQEIDLSHTDSPTVRRLMDEAQSWLGTGYKWGGTDRTGVDCSGFITAVYERALGIRLPRNSRDQMDYCSMIKREQLQQGDLVFFTVRGGNEVGHVGIYVGQGNMIHSSSSNGVVISSLDNPYYVTNYAGSGRIGPFYAMVGKDKSSKKPSPNRAPAAPSAPKSKRAPAKTQTPTISLDEFASLASSKSKTPEVMASNPETMPDAQKADNNSGLESPDEFFE